MPVIPPVRWVFFDVGDVLFDETPPHRLEHNTAAAAINLIRLDAWWTGKPLDPTRTTHLQRLDLAASNPKI